MMFRPLELSGAHLIELELLRDERGYFAQSWSGREFKTHGLNDRIAQCGIAFSHRRGTLRGLHFQSPCPQAKLVRCIRGAIFDVIVDLRSASPSYGRWLSVQLSATGSTMLYVPEGFAHGYQTLEDDTEIAYQMSDDYHPEAEGGIRWNDPHLAIAWPIADPLISARDRSFPDFQP